MGPRRAREHARRRFAAQAGRASLRIRCVGTDSDIVDHDAELLRQAPQQRALQPGELHAREGATRDAALIRDDHQRQPRTA